MNRYETIANPQMIVSFICATFGIISFVSVMFDLGPDSIVGMAIIRMVLGSIYFFGALINLLRGLPSGNLNLIFSVCFGLFAGSNLMISVMDEALGVSVQPMIYGVIQCFAATYLAALLPAMKSIPMSQWVIYCFSSLGLMLQGVYVLSQLTVLNWLSGWCFLAFALFSLYMGLTSINTALPKGPTWIQLMNNKKKR